MSKRAIASLLLTLSISTTIAFADCIDISTEIQSNHSNEIIQSAFVLSENTVIIYLNDETGINYELGSNLDNYAIPFVELESVKENESSLV